MGAMISAKHSMILPNERTNLMMAPAKEKSTVKVNIDYHQHQGNRVKLISNALLVKKLE